MRYYPIFMALQDQPVLVVGGGDVALRKIRLLHSAGAKITVIAPQVCSNLSREFGDDINFILREFVKVDIGDYRLITAATNKTEVNQRVSELAQSKNIPVNVVDQPHLCSFITPSIVDRSPVIIAISTGASAPVLAKTIRAQLEALFPASYGRLANLMSQYRDKVKRVFPNTRERRRFWEKVIHSDIAEKLFSGREKQAEQSLLKQLKDTAENTSTDNAIGEVCLIGAGPGDPDLLTIRALRLMQQADVVLYDRLVSEPILSLIRRDAERIYVGKQRSEHPVPQAEINKLLIDLAKQGNYVVRLKGGDPFIFGRGGEEIELLAESGIPFQIVPGITAASGCATYAGIPLTHRDHAQSCLFVTGHLKNGTVNLDWPLLATPNQTVVVYMGLLGLPTICLKLIEHGVSPDMPIALIEQGTTLTQRVFSATLSTLVERIQNENIHAPTLILIGTVVQLRDQLAWYQKD